MKRILCLTVCVLMLLCGCSRKDTATFYYQRADYHSDMTNGMIAGEERDITGHTDSLSFLISMYLLGPTQSDLISPFPQNTKLLELQQNNTEVIITLSDNLHSMSDGKFTLGCSCLAMTCMELTGTDTVTVVSGQRNITLTPGLMTLDDNFLPTEETTGG